MTKKFACFVILLGSIMPLVSGCGSSDEPSQVEMDAGAGLTPAEEEKIAEEEAGSTDTSTPAP